MALIKCHECGNAISSSAKSCPSCGAPAKLAPKTQPGWNTWPVAIFVVLPLGLATIYLMNSGGNKVQECTERGVAYFKEIGSYPRLSSYPDAGRTAEEVALERCKRTTTAF